MDTPETPSPNTLLDVQFKQYQLFVGTAESNSNQRETTQRYYTTVHTSLLTLLAVVGGYGLLTAGNGGTLVVSNSTFLAQIQAPVVLLICVLGIGLSVLWRMHLSAYRRLNSAKFKVINQIEQALPFQPFNNEWTQLTGAGTAKRKWHVRLTTLEGVVPFVTIVLYVALGVIYFAITLHAQITFLKLS